MVLELCPDGDLDKFLEQHNLKLPENIAVEILRQLMNGFKELVAHGYIHRDIKPANSLVKSGVHKVADFGFAKRIDITGR
jgi:calcium-dependent protein kinase